MISGFKKWTSEDYTALSALVISLCALFVSIRQTIIMGEQQKLSAWPYVYHVVQSSVKDEDSTGQFSIQVHNKGLGPAVIEHLEVLLMDSVYEESQVENAMYRLLETKNIPHHRNSHFNGAAENIILPGDVIRLFEIGDKKLAYLMANEFNNLQPAEFDVIIQYRNLYNTRWKVNRETPLQQRLKHVD